MVALSRYKISNVSEYQGEKMFKNAANILIVDDVEANREALSGLVQIIGHTPIQAEGGLIAFEKLKEHAIDLVFLDVMMPGIDGFEVLNYIKDDATLRHIPVIMITAVDDKNSLDYCMKVGAYDYLTKPFNSIVLQAKMKVCLDKKFWRDKGEEDYRQIKEANLKQTRQ
jgi:CheY-like chemotaxis protein